MDAKKRVVILDDHQSIIDGYLFRLNNVAEIEVIATLSFGEELEPTLAANRADVLMLDINVPTSPENPNPYPILHIIPKLLQMYENLNVLVISMFAERGVIRAVMESGASGYILKEDKTSIRDLGSVLLSIASGGIYFSQRAHQLLLSQKTIPPGEQLSARQLEALSLCVAYPNATTAELSDRMSISNSTFRNLLSSAYLRLGTRNRAAAIAQARQLGIITPHSPNLASETS